MNAPATVSKESLHPGFGPAQLRQVVTYTGVAVLLFWAARFIPTGTALHTSDFQVAGAPGERVLEVCDPSNPQFLPVVAVRSPVSLTLVPPARPLVAGEPARLTARLATAAGKPLAPVDLLVAHTRRLHLMIVDPAAGDYHHVHPTPGKVPGEWHFELTPRASGTYRIFGDFMPAATARGLYTSADFEVQAAGGAAGPPAPPVAMKPNDTVEAEGLRFVLATLDGRPIRAATEARLVFTVERIDGAPVKLAPVMDAYAHLVAFDDERMGFAHLHADQADLRELPDALQPRLTFRITIPDPGRYVIWSQVDADGAERFAPFWFDVVP
jgi:hypothetical protein